MNLLRASGHLASTLTPSEWPSRVPRNGLENILLSLVALKARWNYLALEKGCSALGVLMTEEVGWCVIVLILTIVEAIIICTL